MKLLFFLFCLHFFTIYLRTLSIKAYMYMYGGL